MGRSRSFADEASGAVDHTLNFMKEREYYNLIKPEVNKNNLP